MCNDFSININNSDYNVDLGDKLDYTITIDEVPDVVINLNEQGPAGVQGEKGDPGIQGPQGIGVDRVEPISQQGYEVTYRMYFTDGRYYDYVVSNGTGSLKWVHIEEGNWTLVGDRYRYSYYGSYGVVELFEGSISSKHKIEFDSTIEGNITYVYAIQPFEGYALVAGIENGQIGTYIYEQAIPSDTWVINHNLNRYPSATVVDSAGTQFLVEVKYNDLNTITLYMNGATKGKAYLN